MLPGLAVDYLELLCQSLAVKPSSALQRGSRLMFTAWGLLGLGQEVMCLCTAGLPLAVGFFSNSFMLHLYH